MPQVQLPAAYWAHDEEEQRRIALLMYGFLSNRGHEISVDGILDCTAEFRARATGEDIESPVETEELPIETDREAVRLDFQPASGMMEGGELVSAPSSRSPR